MALGLGILKDDNVNSPFRKLVKEETEGMRATVVIDSGALDDGGSP